VGLSHVSPRRDLVRRRSSPRASRPPCGRCEPALRVGQAGCTFADLTP
jgi:hypothetical protein